ncbi:hypothetical protein [Caulobacter sp. 602-1]|uniref:hypothetical protein n=1 Tax=Caulobacter sp. 602-1 TaxID=2492472 RepID=UPI000F63AE73|nr:hypothetical protein [Caulobacter sp. 602-1]RRN64674.1 hypothetical protein EIK80_11605 [Caulobacter sp. 602-1]
MADVLQFAPRRTTQKLDPNASGPADDGSLIISRPCPFCGEGEQLTLGEYERPNFKDPAINEAGTCVFCEVCDGSAPIDAWNGLILSPSVA